MSAFLNALHEEGTRDEIIFWLGRVAGEKNIPINTIKLDINKATKQELWQELAKLYFI